MFDKTFIALLVASGLCLSVLSMTTGGDGGDTGGDKSPPMAPKLPSSTLCSSSIETRGAVSTGQCSNRGSFRCGIKSRHYEYCSGDHWMTMCPCRANENSGAGAKSTLGT
eukprot:m.218542 g.218542  ORF g.218542 m.218542 type:complete len:110 (+) comp39898_c0_seq48:1095-1424(+)